MSRLPSNSNINFKKELSPISKINQNLIKSNLCVRNFTNGLLYLKITTSTLNLKCKMKLYFKILIKKTLICVRNTNV
jgi:hypothetical protein